MMENLQSGITHLICVASSILVVQAEHISVICCYVAQYARQRSDQVSFVVFDEEKACEVIEVCTELGEISEMLCDFAPVSEDIVADIER